jgi:hypothetical protein
MPSTRKRIVWGSTVCLGTAEKGQGCGQLTFNGVLKRKESRLGTFRMEIIDLKEQYVVEHFLVLSLSAYDHIFENLKEYAPTDPHTNAIR